MFYVRLTFIGHFKLTKFARTFRFRHYMGGCSFQITTPTLVLLQYWHIYGEADLTLK